MLFVVTVMLAAVPVFAAVSEESTTLAFEESQTDAEQAVSGNTDSSTVDTTGNNTVMKKSPPIQVESTERGLVVTWPAVPETDNYMLYRAEDGGELEMVALVGPGGNSGQANMGPDPAETDSAEPDHAEPDSAEPDSAMQNDMSANDPGQAATEQDEGSVNDPGQAEQELGGSEQGGPTQFVTKQGEPKQGAPEQDEPEPAHPLPAVEDPAQMVRDDSGQIIGYSYTDSLILPGKSYHYYIKIYHDKTGTWRDYDRVGAEGTWNITALQIRAGTQLTEDAVRQLGEDSFFDVQEISDELFQRMYGKSYKEYCDIPLDALRYIRCLHRDIDGNIKVGELVMCTEVADKVCEIFHELYRQSYPIESMLLVDDFGASDEDSILHNNTSGFNYRTVDNTAELSNHAFGRAIDINPYYNVYYIPSINYIFPPEGMAYTNREADFPYKLTEGDLCYTLFVNAGFSWGGYFTYNIDYQHFYYNGY